MEITTTNNLFLVKHGNHTNSFKSSLEGLFSNETFSDCSLVGEEGIEIPAHRIILAAASPLLESLLQKHRERHPILFFSEIQNDDLTAIVKYIYKGSVSIKNERFQLFLTAARYLKLSGFELLKGGNEDEDKKEEDVVKLSTEGKISRPPGNASVKKNKWSRSRVPSNVTEIVVKDEESCEFLEESENFGLLAETEEFSASQISADEFEEEYLVEEDEEEMTGNGAYKLMLVRDECSDYIANAALSVTHANASQNESQLSSGATLEDNFRRSSIREVKRKRDYVDKKPVGIKVPREGKTDEWSVKCSECGGQYKSRNTFHNHLRHDCKQVHTCANCLKSFKNKRHLLDHVRDDCGRMHVCLACNRSFKQKVNLTTHMKNYCKTKSIALSPSPAVTDILSVGKPPLVVHVSDITI